MYGPTLAFGRERLEIKTACIHFVHMESISAICVANPSPGKFHFDKLTAVIVMLDIDPYHSNLLRATTIC
jgi:hypothetical protein